MHSTPRTSGPLTSRCAVWLCWVPLLLVLMLQAVGVAAQGTPAGREPGPEIRRDMLRARDNLSTPIPEAYLREVKQAELLGVRLFQADAAALDTLPAAWAKANARALSMPLPRCSGLSYSAVAIDAADSGSRGESAWIYLLGKSHNNEAVVAGIHYRLGLASDGAAFDSVEPSTKRCLAAPARPAEADSVYMFSQSRGCAPNEYHVLLSLQQNHPVLVVSSVGMWKVAGGLVSLVTEQPRLCARQRISELVNRWVVIGGYVSDPDGGDSYQLGMPYIDWQAGLTMEDIGRVRVDAAGRFSWVEGSRHPQYGVKHRLVGTDGRGIYGHASPLPTAAVRDLGLDDPPVWLRNYGGPTDAFELALLRGSYFNHIGDSEAALHHLEPLVTEPGVLPPRLAFELGFAYNALYRYDRAVAVLRPGVETQAETVPGRGNLCRELAYAYDHLGRLAEAMDLYERSFELTSRDPVLRTEVAAKLAVIHQRLGNPDKCREWKERAREIGAGLPSPTQRWLREIDQLSCAP